MASSAEWSPIKEEKRPLFGTDGGAAVLGPAEAPTTYPLGERPNEGNFPKPQSASRIIVEAGESSSTHGLKIHWNLLNELTLECILLSYK